MFRRPNQKRKEEESLKLVVWFSNHATYYQLSVQRRNKLDTERAFQTAERIWKDSILLTLCEFGRTQNVSPHFDPKWKEHGHMDRAVKLLMDWADAQPVLGLTVEKLSLKNEEGNDRTPVIFMELPGKAPGTVLLYGHLDKQPPLDGWREGLSAWDPVLEGDKLYGRGLADDGYATFASVAALQILRGQGLSLPRIVILIEADEESGSGDLPAYLTAYAEKIGTPDLVICLDSGAGDYDRLWMTNSLRGVVNGNLRVDILTEGVHSGASSGVVPDSFMIARQLLDRVQDSATGALKLLHSMVPDDRNVEIWGAAGVLGDNVYNQFPWIMGAYPGSRSETVLLLARTWEPTLTVIGTEGLPALADAGNVLRPYTTLRLSFRIPPTYDPDVAGLELKKVLEKDPPFGALVSFDINQAAPGYNAPSLAPWLEQSVIDASLAFFGQPAMGWGEGGTIPFMGMLGGKFPDAQFLITGVLGPGSNAHGPNEFLHLPTATKLTACVAQVIADFVANHSPESVKVAEAAQSA